MDQACGRVGPLWMPPWALKPVSPVAAALQHCDIAPHELGITTFTGNLMFTMAVHSLVHFFINQLLNSQLPGNSNWSSS